MTVAGERLGPHNDRVIAARELLQSKGRRAQGRFMFEGPTLLREALASGLAVAELFVTETVLVHEPEVQAAAGSGARVGVVDERTMRKLSDVETPTGLVAVAAIKTTHARQLFERPGTVLVLADVSDPGNAGTLLRSAEAFGASGVMFGRYAVDAYHPKVVRSAMGSLFRLPVAIGTPQDLTEAAGAAGAAVVGLAAGGTPLQAGAFPERCAIVVGHERRGLGEWERCCEKVTWIPMHAGAESLNAAVAGSIALYEAAKES